MTYKQKAARLECLALGCAWENIPLLREAAQLMRERETLLTSPDWKTMYEAQERDMAALRKEVERLRADYGVRHLSTGYSGCAGGEDTMKRLTDNELDALGVAHKAATPGEWTLEIDWPYDDESPCDVVIVEINRMLHSTEWADPNDFERDVANARAMVAAHNALPALLAEFRDLRRLTTPEPIGEKHWDGNWWLVWEPGYEHWYKARWRNDAWRISGTHDWPLDGIPTHALPLPGGPDA